jgi:class 3 adenylate cyclase/DNA-binding CsgD family transcriptional regulator/tetratricopeptide (TPR) repeat protein
MPGTVQLAAVLFCDLARSTELLVRLGDPEFDTRRRQFEALVRGAVGGHRGRVVKTLGDGAMATFETASDALGAGIALQQAVRRAAQPEGDDLLMRIGISAGEVTADDGDVFGTTVVEASRLCGAAAPGQVLASSTAAVLTRHGPAPLRPLEPLTLKGFPEPVDAFEVDWTGVPEPGPAGPPLPTALRTTHPIRFVARAKEWEQLGGVWTAAADGGRHAVLLRGEAGAGKTRLAAEFARSVAANGAVVLFGRSREDGGPPYAPIIDALEHLLAHAHELGVDDADANRVRSLLRASHDDEPSPNLTIGDDPRAALFQAVTDVLVAAGRRAEVLLVLDDLQWAGRPTLQLVLHLLRSPAPLRLCMIATHRETPADSNDAFDDALAELHRLDGISRIQVVGLDGDGVAAFVEAAAGGELDAVLAQAARVLALQTDGNPFLLGELWRHFIETGALVREDGRWIALRPFDAFDSPDSVRSVVGRRIDRLPEPARELLEVAAVTGAVFSVELLATVTNTENVAVLELLEPALANATIEQLGPALFGFTHALVWRAIYDRVPASRRAARHLDVARAIEQHDITERGLSVLARHYAAAVPVADPAIATDVAKRAADVAMRSFAFEDAAEMLLRVLPLVDDRAARAELTLRIAEAELPAGDAESALGHLRAAIDLARECARSDLLVRASLAFEDATWRLGLPGTEAERLLREVMPYVTDEPTRVRVLAARGRALAMSGDEAADAVIESAITAARDRGDEGLLRFTLGTWFNLVWLPHRYGLMLERAFELRLLCSDLDDLRMAVHAQQWLVASMLVNAEFAGLRDAVAEHRALSARSKEPFHLHLSAAVESTVAIMEGRLADAEALAEEANELASNLSGPDASGAYGVQMFSLRREQGRLDEVRPVVEAVARLDRAHATWRPALAAMYAELGMLDEARAEVRVLVTPGLPRLPRDSLYLAALTYLADAVAAVGDRTAAATLYASLEPYRNTVVVVGHLIACHGAVDRYLGALAETAGRARDAERHYVRAIELDARAASPTWLAHSRFHYAQFLARQGRRDGPRRAVALLDEVLEAARVIGMPALERRAAELVADLDGHVVAELELAEGPVEIGPAESITRREREILDCLVDGLSNAEIGRTLHISPNTAANHVRAILLKTGCANRTEAATWAVRRGLVSR